MGDMICTLPLLHALRRNLPSAHIVVACDEPGAPIARACGAVSETIVLETRGFHWLRLLRDARRLQGFDWVIAAKGGFDRRLALLSRLSNGIRRVGFEEKDADGFVYYTDPVALPNDAREHQIETQLRLLSPLRIDRDLSLVKLDLELPETAQKFAENLTAKFSPASAEFMLINISSTSRLLFSEKDFLEMFAWLLIETCLAIGVVAAPADQAKARDLARQAASERVVALATPGPLELAALLQRAAVLLTPEGGAAHLAAAMGTPAVVLWSEGPFEKWHSRGERHVFVRAEANYKNIPAKKVQAALQTLFPDNAGAKLRVP